jgi:hypothetical protein
LPDNPVRFGKGAVCHGEEGARDAKQSVCAARDADTPPIR